MTGTQQSGSGGNPSFDTPDKSAGGVSKSQGSMSANPGKGQPRRNNQGDNRPSTPTPEDPRERTPMQDPPLEPERDNTDPTRLQGDDDESAQIEERTSRGGGGSGSHEGRQNASSDQVVIDTNKTER